MPRTPIKKYQPHYYDGVLEMEELARLEDEVLDEANDALLEVKLNQYVLTANERGIQWYEGMLDIIAKPSIETLQFRRERVLNRLSTKPPFTTPYLRQKLNETIGVGQYNLRVDSNAYTLYIESSAQNQGWFIEISVMVNKIKPANIVFINKPYIHSVMLLGETIEYSGVTYNYNLGTSWVLGDKPFASFDNKGVIHMASAKSLTDELLSDVATFTAGDIVSVLINDTYSVTTFSVKEGQGNAAVIEYSLPVASNLDEITNIKLLGTNGRVLSNATVYVPVVEDMLIKHNILAKEGA